MSNAPCPLCAETEIEIDTSKGGLNYLISCPNCGSYRLSHTMAQVMYGGKGYSAQQRGLLSHAVRKMQRGVDGIRPMLTTGYADEILKATTYPGAVEVIDNLLIHLAALGGPGTSPNSIPFAHLRAPLGVVDAPSACWAVEQAIEIGVIRGNVSQIVRSTGRVLSPSLTLAGWERLDEIHRAGGRVRKAFMAMDFGDPIIVRAYAECFRPAASRCGYDLRILTEGQSAGLIDDRLRTELRTSRFVIADETHANRGAYWEAGFAEGLGRPVVYTCMKDHWDSTDKNLRPHFDTNHYLHVLWDPEALKQAEDALVAIIRATLPSEAKLDDD